MFGNIKKKLKGFVDKAGKEAETEEVEEKVLVEEEIKEPSSFFSLTT